MKMVLDDEELLSPSEFRLVMDDIQSNFPTNLVEDSSQLFSEPLENMCGSSQTYDSDNSDSKPKRKKPKRMCDSTFVNPTFQNPGPLPVEELPCLEPYQGQFDFQLQLPTDSSAHRWTFSKVLKKIFIDIDKVLALQFRWNYSELKPDYEFFIRAMPVYTSHDSLKVPVMRCPIHLLPDNSLNVGFHFVEHVMRCEHSSTTYFTDQVTKRLSCITPLNRPQPGSDTTTLTYKFVCKTSCLGGMNRKPISVIFTLEDAAANEYGRQLLAVKICSCPKRDKAKEEKNEHDKTQSCARLVKPLDATPNMLSVRTSDGATHSHIEALRDVKNVSCSDLETSSLFSDSPESRSLQAAFKNAHRLKKDRYVDVEDVMLFLREMDEKMTKMAKMTEHLYRTETVGQSSNGKFCKYIEAQLNEMPVEVALESQNEITKFLTEKKLLMLRQNMITYCPTPEPSVTSPCSASNEWQY